jgi:hypothetical protein
MLEDPDLSVGRRQRITRILKALEARHAEPPD